MKDLFVKNMGAPNLVNVCIDVRGDQGSSGRMYCRYEKEARRFENEYQLIKLLEELMERIGYPQSSVEMRTYSTQQRRSSSRPRPVMEPDELAGYRGERATFLIHVRYWQNATWQGEVCWVEQERTAAFRSALELLKLIDSAR